MKRMSMVALLTGALTSISCFSQPMQTSIVEDVKLSTLNQPGQDYPQVNSQGYVRFRVKAPRAGSIRVSLGLGGRSGTKLTKGADGYFTGTAEGPRDEGFNYYGSVRWESGIEIPALTELKTIIDSQ